MLSGLSLNISLSYAGASFHPANCGPRVQTSFEQRSDVLIYTSAPLEEVVDVVGAVKLEVMCHVDTDRVHLWYLIAWLCRKVDRA